MKKTFLLILTLALGASAARAQVPQPLPMDPNVRYGHLDNGLTYYIAHNELPEHHVDFYISQRVGSVLEEESQRGLAHFLEHMAFNGTKNFPGKSMLDYLQRHGVKFGTNVNAYTSFDQTVYNICDVPTDPTAHPNIVDSCLLMLHDWSGYISLLGDEIDKERGVIHEEWRSRNSAGLRMMQNVVMPALMSGTPYPDRLPIGLMSVVDSCSYDELRAYYRKWYRPDLQAIIVVGDVNVDSVEQKVRTLWQDIQTPADAATRTYATVPDNDEPLVCVATDAEFPYNAIDVMFKRTALPREVKLSAIGYSNALMQNVLASVINTRLAEIAQKPEAPFMGAQVDFGDYLYAPTRASFNISITCKPGQWAESLRDVMATVRSVQQFGVTSAEVERTKAEIRSGYENAYNERNKRKNRSIVGEINRHYLSDEPMPGIEVEWLQLWPTLEQGITPDALHPLCQSLVSDTNMALSFMGQEKEGNVIPTEQQLLAAYNAAVAQPAVAYAEEEVKTQLVGRCPKPGKVKKSESGPYGSTIWTLSNGVRVVWKATDFKQDQVSMQAYSHGGSRRHPAESRVARNYASALYSLGGVADFTPIALGKALSGKNASAATYIASTAEGLSGSCAPKDIRTMFELTYLRFTQPRQDTALFRTWLSRNVQQLKNSEGTPNRIISDSLYTTLYRGQTDYLPLTADELATIDYDRTFQLAKSRFANAADFTFFLIGNIDADSLRTMCCQYLATLPADKSREARIDADLPTRGSRENSFTVPMTQPKTTVTGYYLLNDQPATLREQLTVTILGQVLRMVFTETIREEEGGTYSPRASASCNRLEHHYELNYSFDTGADKLEHVNSVALREMQKVAQPGGVSRDFFQKVHDYLAKQYAANQKENSYWMSQIRSQYLYSMGNQEQYMETLDSITPADVEAMMARFLGGNHVVMVANGVEKD